MRQCSSRPDNRGATSNAGYSKDNIITIIVSLWVVSPYRWREWCMQWPICRLPRICVRGHSLGTRASFGEGSSQDTLWLAVIDLRILEVHDQTRMALRKAHRVND